MAVRNCEECLWKVDGECQKWNCEYVNARLARKFISKLVKDGKIEVLADGSITEVV